MGAFEVSCALGILAVCSIFSFALGWEISSKVGVRAAKRLRWEEDNRWGVEPNYPIISGAIFEMRDVGTIRITRVTAQLQAYWVILDSKAGLGPGATANAHLTKVRASVRQSPGVFDPRVFDP